MSTACPHVQDVTRLTRKDIEDAKKVRTLETLTTTFAGNALSQFVDGRRSNVHRKLPVAFLWL